MKCVKKIGDTQYMNDVIKIESDPNYIVIENSQKADGRLVYAARTSGDSGFFAELRFLIHELYFADKYGLIPTAAMSEKISYYETNGVNGTKNPFEYYFCPVSDISYDEAEKNYAFVRHTWYQRFLIEEDSGIPVNGYEINDEYIKKMSRIVKKYLRFNENTQSYLDSNCLVFKGKSVLGVHVRGADFKRHYKNHPMLITAEESLKRAKEIFSDGKYDKLFLATDDSEAVEIFQNEFQNDLILFADVVRTNGDETVMKSEIERPKHHYLLGLEVIRDMYALSLCDGLIAGMSNVSIFSRILKKSRNEEFHDLIIINKGIVR